MQPGLESSIVVPPTAKPILISYDSAEECSFNHWIELCKLVDESDSPDVEEPVEATVLEV